MAYRSILDELWNGRSATGVGSPSLKQALDTTTMEDVIDPSFTGNSPVQSGEGMSSSDDDIPKRRKRKSRSSTSTSGNGKRAKVTGGQHQARAISGIQEEMALNRKTREEEGRRRALEQRAPIEKAITKLMKDHHREEGREEADADFIIEALKLFENGVMSHIYASITDPKIRDQWLRTKIGG